MLLGLTLKNINLKSLSSCSKCIHVPHNTFLSSTNSRLWIKSQHSNQFKQHVSKLSTFSNCLQKNASDSSDSNLTDTKTPLQEKTDEISDDSTPLRINVDKEILRYDYEEFVVKEEDDFEFQQKEISLPFSPQRKLLLINYLKNSVFIILLWILFSMPCKFVIVSPVDLVLFILHILYHNLL